MEGHCSTGQSPQWAVVPMEEEEEEEEEEEVNNSIKMKISVKQWWNGTDRGKAEYWEKSLIQDLFVLYMCHVERPEIEPRHPR